MLGNTIVDSEGIETAGTYRGFGLIDMDTVFEKEKKTKRVSGRINKLDGILKNLSDMEYCGYEIHMGKSKNDDVILSGIKNVYGTYIHGIFDKKDISEGLIKSVAEIKGIKDFKVHSSDMDEYKNQQYDILADGVRKSLDMNEIYGIIRNGV